MASCAASQTKADKADNVESIIITSSWSVREHLRWVIFAPYDHVMFNFL